MSWFSSFNRNSYSTIQERQDLIPSMSGTNVFVNIFDEGFTVFPYSDLNNDANILDSLENEHNSPYASTSQAFYDQTIIAFVGIVS